MTGGRRTKGRQVRHRPQAAPMKRDAFEASSLLKARRFREGRRRRTWRRRRAEGMDERMMSALQPPSRESTACLNCVQSGLAQMVRKALFAEMTYNPGVAVAGAANHVFARALATLHSLW